MAHIPANSGPAPKVRLLALDIPLAGDREPPDSVVAMARFADLDADLLAGFMPNQILLPLVSPDHDAIAVVERLNALGYAGAITVVARHLPNARMVETELRALGPGKRLTLLTSPE